MHVPGLLRAEGEGSCHAEFGVETLRGVGVDRIGAVGGGSVELDQIWLSVADDDDSGPGRQGRDGEGLCEGAEIFLAVLESVSGVLCGDWAEKELTPQKKCRTKSTRTLSWSGLW